LFTIDVLKEHISSKCETSEKRTIWEQYKIKAFCSLLRGCPLLEIVNVLILVQNGVFVMYHVERLLIHCPFHGGSFKRGSTVVESHFYNSDTSIIWGQLKWSEK